MTDAGPNGNRTRLCALARDEVSLIGGTLRRPPATDCIAGTSRRDLTEHGMLAVTDRRDSDEAAYGPDRLRARGAGGARRGAGGHDGVVAHGRAVGRGDARQRRR